MRQILILKQKGRSSIIIELYITKMKKNTIKLISLFICLSLLAGCAGPKSDTNPNANVENQEGKNTEIVHLNLGHALSEGTKASQLLAEFAKSISEKTEGRVVIDDFPNSQLGSETEMLEQMKIGSLEAAGIMVGSMQSLDIRMAIEDLPYMWKDIEHARNAYDGEFGNYLANVMNEQGMKKIGYLEWGFRHITNNKKPIVKPEDMSGVKIRVAQTKLRVDAFEQLGSLPTILAFSELYGALQQGVVDAQENPLTNTLAANFNEVQDYLSLTGHFYNTVMMVVNNKVWDKISPADQEIILTEMDKVSDEVRKSNDELEAGYIKELESRGMKVNDDVDKQAFREKMLPVYDKWEESSFGKELMDIYREASGW